MSVAQLLSFRFLIAAVGMLVLTASFGHGPFRMGRRRLILLLAVGGAFYGLQTFVFFAALTGLPASLVELLLYTYPAFVVLSGWLILGRKIARSLFVAVPLSLAGEVLLIGWGAKLEFNFALLLALLLPISNTVYLFVAERVMRGEHPLRAGAFLMLGAAIFWLFAAATRGQLTPPTDLAAWLVVCCLAIVPSMFGIPLLLAALARIPSERVALLSTFEPVVTVLLALALLGEQLQPIQIVGAILVLGSAVILQWPIRSVWRAAGLDGTSLS
jgi:drug/metabolite transporter (DMT)-like permease